MPSKRDVLEQLKRDELLAALDRFELEVRDRRVRGDLVGTLSSSRKAALAAILEDLPRTRLKEICRALNLDDSGREKAVLVTRLTGQAGTSKLAPPPALVPRNVQPDPTRAPATSSDKLTREALERHLWSAADILRGSIDSSDYKNYILGLLFLKRLSDRFEEECEIVRDEGRDPEDSGGHQFYVPPEARWETLEKAEASIGERLNWAVAALEKKNPVIRGVFHGIDFSDEQKLGDIQQRDRVLNQLIMLLSRLNLRNTHLPELNTIGDVYESLIERFARAAGKQGRELHTPRQVARLLVDILQPQDRMEIYDPACGSGTMLIQCAEYVERSKGSMGCLQLYGQEKNAGMWAVCKMNLLVHGLLDSRIEWGDTIRDPKFTEGGDLMTFDLVLANPPFSLRNWGQEMAEKDPWRRFRFGVPPRSLGDFAFVQHMVASLKPKGRMAVVLPHGVLFRGGREAEIRRALVEADLLELVIGLPPNLFYGTGIPTVLIVASKEKPEQRRGNILFVDGSEKGALRGSASILSLIKSSNFQSAWARSVSLEEISKNDSLLNPNHYLYHSLASERSAQRAQITLAATEKWDVFLSYASEESDFASKIQRALEQKNIRVWFDKLQLVPGDDLRQAIDAGVKRSKHGVVLLSPSFFQKTWTNRELNSLFAREDLSSRRVVPLWHGVTRENVLDYSPLLADRVAIDTSACTFEELVRQIIRAIHTPRLDTDYDPIVIEWPTGSYMTVLRIKSEEGKALCVGYSPVTNGEYRAYVRDARIDSPKGTLSLAENSELIAPWDDPCLKQLEQPVVCVSYSDAIAFCKWANRAFPHPAGAYTSLPTPELWNYAAFGQEEFPDDRGMWLRQLPGGVSSCAPQAVDSARKRATHLGLSDMFGNVWQWCGHTVEEERPTPAQLRGGSFADDLYTVEPRMGPHTLRDGHRTRCITIGFRLAGVLPIEHLPIKAQIQLERASYASDKMTPRNPLAPPIPRKR